MNTIAQLLFVVFASQALADPQNTLNAIAKMISDDSKLAMRDVSSLEQRLVRGQSKALGKSSVVASWGDEALGFMVADAALKQVDVSQCGLVEASDSLAAIQQNSNKCVEKALCSARGVLEKSRDDILAQELGLSSNMDQAVAECAVPGSPSCAQLVRQAEAQVAAASSELSMSMGKLGSRLVGFYADVDRCNLDASTQAGQVLQNAETCVEDALSQTTTTL